MTQTERLNSLKAAIECIVTAKANIRINNDISAEIAIDNAISSLQSAKKIRD